MRAWLLLLVLLVAPAAAQDYDALVAEALSLRNQGEMIAAESKLREAHRVAADKREAAYLLGLVLAFQEKYAEAEKVLRDALRQYPDDTNLVLASARVRAYQGQHAEALEAVGRVLDVDPDNTEALNLAGRVSLYRQQYASGEAYFRSVLDIDEQNLEAVIGLHDAELYLGNNKSAMRYLDMAEGLAPDHADVRQRKDRVVSSDVPRHEVLFGYGVSRFDRAGFARWRDRFIEYRHGAGGSNQQFLRYEHAHRFGIHDSLWEAGAIFNTARGVPIEIAAGVGRDELFLPRSRFRVGVGFRLNRGGDDFGASLGRLSLRQSRYITGTTRQLFLDLEHYFVDINGWVVPGIGVTRDETGRNSFSWKVAVNLQPWTRWRWGLSYIDAPETENNVTTDTRTLHGYVRYRFSNRVALRVDFSRNEREFSYTRTGVDATLSYRF